MFKFNKKAIGPVIATALLLVVAVGSITMFQSWFKTYQSGINSNIETQSNSGFGSLSIEGIFGNKLYIKNKIQDNLSIISIKIGSVECNLTGQNNLSLGVTTINISSCVNSSTPTASNVILLTKGKIIDKTVLLRDQVPPCNALDGIQLNSGQSYPFFNSTRGIICYSQNRTCNDRVISGDSNYNYSSCNLITSLSCLTDNDGDGDINSSCAVYPMTNTTYEGDLDVNDNNATIKPDMTCLYSGKKNQCVNNLIINGCGTKTVLDLATNLCWQQNMSTAGQINWTDAKTYCSGLSLGGHNDWYLPSRQELFTITDLSRYSPAIIGGDNNKFTNVLNNYYWSSSTYGILTSYAWRVNFFNGDSNGNDKTGTHYVVCVRRN